MLSVPSPIGDMKKQPSLNTMFMEIYKYQEEFKDISTPDFNIFNVVESVGREKALPLLSTQVLNLINGFDLLDIEQYPGFIH